MAFYPMFLSVLCVLFAASSAVLLVLALLQFARRRGRRAAVYLGLTLLAGVVAAGFYFFRNLF
jgi:hypothetical protein